MRKNNARVRLFVAQYTQHWALNTVNPDGCLRFVHVVPMLTCTCLPCSSGRILTSSTADNCPMLVNMYQPCLPAVSVIPRVLCIKPS